MMIAFVAAGGVPDELLTPSAAWGRGHLCLNCREIPFGYRVGYGVICLTTHTARAHLRIRGGASLNVELDCRTGELRGLAVLNTPARRAAWESFSQRALHAYRDLITSPLEETA